MVFDNDIYDGDGEFDIDDDFCNDQSSLLIVWMQLPENQIVNPIVPSLIAREEAKFSIGRLAQAAGHH